MKTRKDILEEYDVDTNGVIRSPGKFEGEMIYAPYFWFLLLDGGADEDNGDVALFRVTDEDRAQFPELDLVTQISLSEDEQGFVCVEEQTVFRSQT